MYVRGYLQGSENGRVVTIDNTVHKTQDKYKTLEKTEGAIKDEQSRDNDNTIHKTHDK
jgi:hypothetical protein